MAHHAPQPLQGVCVCVFECVVLFSNPCLPPFTPALLLCTWRACMHLHTCSHLSTDFEQTLRQHDAGRAADCWHPCGKGEGLPLRRENWQSRSIAPRSQVQCLLAVANRLNGTSRPLIRVRGKSSPCRMLPHHGVGAQLWVGIGLIARGDAESVSRAPP